MRAASPELIGSNLTPEEQLTMQQIVAYLLCYREFESEFVSDAAGSVERLARSGEIQHVTTGVLDCLRRWHPNSTRHFCHILNTLEWPVRQGGRYRPDARTRQSDSSEHSNAIRREFAA